VRTKNQDDRLAARALSLGWPVPRSELTTLVRAMIKIVLSRSKKTSARAKVGAFKALAAVEKNNLETIKVSIFATEHEDLVKQLQELQAKCERFERLDRPS
jgi:hypothetical protein